MDGWMDLSKKPVVLFEKSVVLFIGVQYGIMKYRYWISRNLGHAYYRTHC